MFIVRENLAHSWVEVYFTGLGWQRLSRRQRPMPVCQCARPRRQADAAEDRTPAEPDDLGNGTADDILRRLEEERLANQGESDPEEACCASWRIRAHERLALAGTIGGVLAALAAVGAIVLTGLA